MVAAMVNDLYGFPGTPAKIQVGDMVLTITAETWTDVLRLVQPRYVAGKQSSWDVGTERFPVILGLVYEQLAHGQTPGPTVETSAPF